MGHHSSLVFFTTTVGQLFYEILRVSFSSSLSDQDDPAALPEFKLWLEFEAVDPGNWDIYNDFCNIAVYLPDGRRYGINVWTFQFLQTATQYDQENGEDFYSLNGIYQVPPDLFVKELTRDCIEQTISHLLTKGNLEDVLNPTVGPNEEMDDDELMKECFFDPPLTIEIPKTSAEIDNGNFYDDPETNHMIKQILRSTSSGEVSNPYFKINKLSQDDASPGDDDSQNGDNQ